MLEAVRDFAELTGPLVGVKVAGGIRTAKDAIRYLVIVNETVGEAWLDPSLFRFGASSLLNDLLMQRSKQLSGAYAGSAGLQHRIARSTEPSRFLPARFPRLDTHRRPSPARSCTSRPSYGLFIGGAFVEPVGGNAYKTENPATEEVLAEVAAAGAEDVDRAVEVAGRAQKEVWGPMSGAERAKYLFRVARIIQERARELAVLESLDNGKPIHESRDVDVPWLQPISSTTRAGRTSSTTRASGRAPRPIGVAGQVIPWNFPLMMAAWKLAPALAAGNTCVLKPASNDAV